MEKISLAVLQNGSEILFEDALLCKITNLILLDSKYLVILDMQVFRDVLNSKGRGDLALSEVLAVFSILHLQRHLFFTSPYFLLNEIESICIIQFATNHFLEPEICVSFAWGFRRRITDGLSRNFFHNSIVYVF